MNDELVSLCADVCPLAASLSLFSCVPPSLPSPSKPAYPSTLPPHLPLHPNRKPTRTLTHPLPLRHPYQPSSRIPTRSRQAHIPRTTRPNSADTTAAAIGIGAAAGQAGSEGVGGREAKATGAGAAAGEAAAGLAVVGAEDVVAVGEPALAGV